MGRAGNDGSQRVLIPSDENTVKLPHSAPELQSSSGERPLAVVTGASSGIGATYAQRLAQEGYDLLLIARRADRLQQLCREIAARGGQARALAADLTRDDDVARVEEELGAAKNLEFLVNNAGFGTYELFHEADPSGQAQMHQLHVVATVRLTRAALPRMVARNRGYIVNVSSVSGFMQGPYSVSYCATKTWMNSFTEGLHLEMRKLGTAVRVQALCPGFTVTEFHQTMNMDRSFAGRSWWMTPESVVEESLAGARKGRLYVIPGLRYKLIVALLRLLPRPMLHALVGRAPNVRRGESRHQVQ